MPDPRDAQVDPTNDATPPVESSDAPPPAPPPDPEPADPPPVLPPTNLDDERNPPTDAFRAMILAAESKANKANNRLEDLRAIFRALYLHGEAQGARLPPLPLWMTDDA